MSLNFDMGFVKSVVCSLLEEWDESDHPRGKDGKFSSGGDSAVSEFEKEPAADRWGKKNPKGKFVIVTKHEVASDSAVSALEKGVNLALISKAPVKEVALFGLKVIQPVVDAEKTKKMIRDFPADKEHELPVVVKKGKDMYLWDGTHRAVAAGFLGKEKIKVKFLELD